MDRDRATPHIAWPLKLFAVGAVAAAVLAGANELRGDDDADPATLRRAGSVEVKGTVTASIRPFPSAYTVTSRVSAADSTSTEVHRVVAPFDATTERPGQEVLVMRLIERS